MMLYRLAILEFERIEKKDKSHLRLQVVVW